MPRAGLDAGALGGGAGDAGGGGAAVDQEARRPAVQLGIDPEMAVGRLADADLARRGLLDRAAPHLDHQPAAERQELVLEREDDEGGAEDQHPADEHLQALGDRHPAHHEGARHKDEASNKINEIKGLIAFVHKSTSSPS